jgi:biopolymer transport protein ExbD
MSISLPRATADPLSDRPKEVVVGVDAQGQYFIDRAPYQFTTVVALADALRLAAGGSADTTLIISADGQAVHQRVVHVMDAGRQAGLHKILFATQSPRTE